VIVEGGVGGQIVNGSAGRGGRHPQQSPGFCLSLSSPSPSSSPHPRLPLCPPLSKISHPLLQFPFPALSLVSASISTDCICKHTRSQTSPPAPSCTRTVAHAYHQHSPTPLFFCLFLLLPRSLGARHRSGLLATNNTLVCVKWRKYM
jgi:hypothetical protein